MALLTRKERDQFMVYCAQEAATEKGMIEQFENLPDSGMHDVMIKRMKTRAAGYSIVAEDLGREFESVEL